MKLREIKQQRVLIPVTMNPARYVLPFKRSGYEVVVDDKAVIIKKLC